jgi:RNA polymerase sigma factor (sigma-70 family)
MSDGQRPALLAYLRQLGRGGAIESRDAELLERFADQHDEAAFAALMRRHGPLVWSVCRRVLGEEHAAEDAFQATFLVLVRKARSVSKRASVRSWLYGVALRVAVRARQQEGLREQSAPPRQAAEASWDDVRPVLDEEIGRLPKKYRLPIILCYLEGQSNDEAARQLNCPRGTIATRLARARDKLRSRLVRRGLTLSTTTLAAMLAENVLSAAVPMGLLAQATKAAGTGAAPVAITRLTEGVLHAMFVTKLKTTLAVVLALVLIGGAGAYTWYLRAQQPVAEELGIRFPEKVVRAKPAPAKSAEEIRKLLKERRAMAEQEAKVRYEKYRAGAQDATLDLSISSCKRLLKAELELSKTKADRLAARERYLKLMKEVAKICKARYNLGRGSLADFQ